MNPPRVRRPGVVLLGVVALLAVAPAAARQPAAPPPFDGRAFLPLADGSKWEYQVTLGNRSTPSEGETITVGRATLRGKEYVTSRLTRQPSFGPDTVLRTNLLQVTPEGVYVAGNLGDDSYQIYQSPHGLIRFTDKATEWTFGDNTYSGPDGKVVPSNFFKNTKTQRVEKFVYLGREVDAVHVTEVNQYFRTELFYVKDVGLVQEAAYYLERPIAGQRSYEKKLKSVALAPGLTIGKIALGDLVDKEASAEAVDVTAGVTAEFERSRTITREVRVASKLGLEAEVEAKVSAGLVAVRGELTKRIKGTIEQEQGEKLTDSETRKQTVRIDGNVLPKASIVWVDTYRKGTVEVTRDAQSYQVPFEFPVGTKLIVRPRR